MLSGKGGWHGSYSMPTLSCGDHRILSRFPCHAHVEKWEKLSIIKAVIIKAGTSSAGLWAAPPRCRLLVGWLLVLFLFLGWGGTFVDYVLWFSCFHVSDARPAERLVHSLALGCFACVGGPGDGLLFFGGGACSIILCFFLPSRTNAGRGRALVCSQHPCAFLRLCPRPHEFAGLFGWSRPSLFVFVVGRRQFSLRGSTNIRGSVS